MKNQIQESIDQLLESSKDVSRHTMLSVLKDLIQSGVVIPKVRLVKIIRNYSGKDLLYCNTMANQLSGIGGMDKIEEVETSINKNLVFQHKESHEWMFYPACPHDSFKFTYDSNLFHVWYDDLKIKPVGKKVDAFLGIVLA